MVFVLSQGSASFGSSPCLECLVFGLSMVAGLFRVLGLVPAREGRRVAAFRRVSWLFRLLPSPSEVSYGLVLVLLVFVFPVVCLRGPRVCRFRRFRCGLVFLLCSWYFTWPPGEDIGGMFFSVKTTPHKTVFAV